MIRQHRSGARLSLFGALLLVVAQSPAAEQVAISDERVVIRNEGWQIAGNLMRPAQTQRAQRVPAVLLLNGAGRDRRDYDLFARELAGRGIGSLRIDLRGMGESTNLGRFIPFDSTGNNDRIAFDRGWSDVRQALRFLEAQSWVDPDRIGGVGASFSGEALAVAIAGSQRPRAVALISPGSFSDSSLANVDRDGRRWLFVYSAREMIERRFGMIDWTRRGTDSARVIVVADSAHATRLLLGSPLLIPRLAEWFSRSLTVSTDDRWRRAADDIAASVGSNSDDLLRPGVATNSLGDGTAGRLRFLLEWHALRGDSASARAAHAAASELVAQLTPDSGAAGTSLYRGAAGVAWVLHVAAQRLHEPRYRAVGDSVARALQRSARNERGAMSWSEANDVMTGDAGIAAAYDGIWRLTRDSVWRDIALATARSLIARARTDSGGLNWRWRESAPFVLPNFSHGAAGIGTTLAMLGGEPAAPSELLAASIAAARYLRLIGTDDARGFRIPNGWPVPAGGWDRPFDAGWAHGQAGSIRLFWELWRTTRDTSYLATARAMVRGIDSARVLGAPHTDYGTARFGVDSRFGLAGIGEMFADLYDQTGDRAYLDRALRMAEELLQAATPDGNGLAWTAPRPVFVDGAGTPARFTGLLHGAAGPGVFFLKLDALLSGRRPPLAMPDSPFGDR